MWACFFFPLSGHIRSSEFDQWTSDPLRDIAKNGWKYHWRGLWSGLWSWLGLHFTTVLLFLLLVRETKQLVHFKWSMLAYHFLNPSFCFSVFLFTHSHTPAALFAIIPWLHLKYANYFDVWRVFTNVGFKSCFTVTLCDPMRCLKELFIDRKCAIKCFSLWTVAKGNV